MVRLYAPALNLMPMAIKLAKLRPKLTCRAIFEASRMDFLYQFISKLSKQTTKPTLKH